MHINYPVTTATWKRNAEVKNPGTMDCFPLAGYSFITEAFSGVRYQTGADFSH